MSTFSAKAVTCPAMSMMLTWLLGRRTFMVTLACGMLTLTLLYEIGIDSGNGLQRTGLVGMHANKIGQARDAKNLFVMRVQTVTEQASLCAPGARQQGDNQGDSRAVDVLDGPEVQQNGFRVVLFGKAY